ncbi:MAG: FecR domain-containing protein [Ignavibacteria bacterium]|jgi:ferric-dicitrate binding protein FerR (iron transport regulator)
MNGENNSNWAEGIDWQLITNYIAGECKEAELSHVRQWIKEDPSRELKIKELRKILHTGKRQHSEEHAKVAWEDVERRTGISSTQKLFTGKKTLYSLTARIIKVAAVLVIMLGCYYVLSQSGIFTNGTEAEVSLYEKTTEPGQKSILTFFDGTRITLNAGSKLRYPKQFKNSKREVYLEGEAYFEVAHNPDRPFIVHSGKISTTVLGTKFNVKAFPNEKEIAVSLIEGSVKIYVAEKEEQLLVPEQQLSYNKLTGSEQVKEFDLVQVTGWKDNILKFVSVPLENVFAQLERTYGVKFILEDAAYAQEKIRAGFNNESFWTVIKVIKSASGLEYRTITEKDEIKAIVFYKADSKKN